MNPFGYIYKITNVFNGKVYVGQTTQKDPFKRIAAHFKSSIKIKQLIHKAIAKHGKEQFKCDVLFCAFDRKSLDEHEIYFIKNFQSLVPNGYNLTSGGSSGGNIMTPEIKLKLSLSRQRYYKTHDGFFKGKKFSKAHCLALSRARKGFTSDARKQANKRTVKLRMKQIKAINIATQKEFIFNSAEEAAKQLNCISSCISRVCRGDQNRTQHRGFTFSYLKDTSAKPKPLRDKTLGGIKKIRGKYVVVVKTKIYLGSFKTLTTALKAKTLFFQNEMLYKKFILDLINKKELVMWKKRKPK